MHQIGCVRFPIFTIESFDGHFIHGPGIKATSVDVYAIGIAAGDVKTLDPADFAKEMFRNAGIESVFGQKSLASYQTKSERRHDQVQEAGDATQRTIAILYGDVSGGIDFKNNAAAMTAAAMGNQVRTCSH